MKSANESSSPITLVISELVEPDRIEDYEIWAKGINQVSRQVEGFLEVEVIRPRDHEYPEYVVIVKFESYACLRKWMASKTYHEWIEKSHGLIASRSLQELPSGMEIWFSLPRNAPYKPPQPPYYKQVILGVLAVYPLILLANVVLGPFLKGLPFLLGLLISVTAVSALLTYPVMPGLTRLLGFWLYPSMTKRKTKRKATGY